MGIPGQAPVTQPVSHLLGAHQERARAACQFPTITALLQPLCRQTTRSDQWPSTHCQHPIKHQGGNWHAQLALGLNAPAHKHPPAWAPNSSHRGPRGHQAGPLNTDRRAPLALGGSAAKQVGHYGYFRATYPVGPTHPATARRGPGPALHALLASGLLSLRPTPL